MIETFEENARSPADMALVVSSGVAGGRRPIWEICVLR